MSTVYWIVPASNRVLWFLIPILTLIVVVMALLLGVWHGARRSHFELTDSALRLHGDVWGRTLPWDSLDLPAARVIDLRGEPAWQPKSRRLGTGLPGFLAGWFRLRNGEKALVYLTDRTRVLHIPTRSGYSILLSPQRPDAMLADMRERASR